MQLPSSPAQFTTPAVCPRWTAAAKTFSASLFSFTSPTTNFPSEVSSWNAHAAAPAGTGNINLARPVVSVRVFSKTCDKTTWAAASSVACEPPIYAHMIRNVLSTIVTWMSTFRSSRCWRVPPSWPPCTTVTPWALSCDIYRVNGSRGRRRLAGKLASHARLYSV